MVLLPARKWDLCGVPAGFRRAMWWALCHAMTCVKWFGIRNLGQSSFLTTSQEIARPRSWAQEVAGSNPVAPDLPGFSGPVIIGERRWSDSPLYSRSGF